MKDQSKDRVLLDVDNWLFGLHVISIEERHFLDSRIRFEFRWSPTFMATCFIIISFMAWGIYLATK